MCSQAHGKRLVFLGHRWTGVESCLLMALWLFSSVVMLFVGYPRPAPPRTSLPISTALWSR